MSSDTLVSVVIPAHNAARTLDATLDSVCAQSHRALEIIVVDDGSTDTTAAIAQDRAARDPRVRVLRTPNRGVAAARNAGIRASAGAFVAPVDADDLWHPDKIAHQLAAMLAGGDAIGFVYTPYRVIDAEDRVLASRADIVEGATFLRLLLLNFVGNGSALLIRRAAFDAVGGYDSRLRNEGVQGCEDYLLQLLIARHWKVACVPQYLTGYRRTAGNMSSDDWRMLRSKLRMFEIVTQRVPDAPPRLVNAAIAAAQLRCGLKLLRRGDLARAMPEFRDAFRRDPVMAARNIWCALSHLVYRLVPRRLKRPEPETGAAFLTLDPAVPPAPPALSQRWPRWWSWSWPQEYLLGAAARDEAAFFAQSSAADTRASPDLRYQS